MRLTILYGYVIVTVSGMISYNGALQFMLPPAVTNVDRLAKDQEISSPLFPVTAADSKAVISKRTRHLVMGRLGQTIEAMLNRKFRLTELLKERNFKFNYHHS